MGRKSETPVEKRIAHVLALLSRTRTGTGRGPGQDADRDTHDPLLQVRRSRAALTPGALTAPGVQSVPGQWRSGIRRARTVLAGVGDAAGFGRCPDLEPLKFRQGHDAGAPGVQRVRPP